MTLTTILLVANLIVALLLVLVVGYMWRLIKALSVVAIYTNLYLNDKYGDFGSKKFEEME